MFERSTGRVFIEAYDKLKKDEDDKRVGPPTVKDVRPLVEKLDEGSILFTDGARAYGLPMVLGRSFLWRVSSQAEALWRASHCLDSGY